MTLDLKRWKDIERNAQAQLEEAETQMHVSDLILQDAIVNIKRLGGMTAREEDAEAKKQAEKDQKNNHITG